MPLRTEPYLATNAEGDLFLRVPTDGGAGDDDVTLLGHVSDNPTVPFGMERELSLLLDEWRDGLSFAAGCRAACDAAYEAAISGGLRP